MLHSFRFIGLAFLVPGVVSPDLPSGFAQSAAYGDIVAATLALLSLPSLPGGPGVVLAWGFNIWGTADLLNAFRPITQAFWRGNWEPPTSFRLSWCRCYWSRTGSLSGFFCDA